MFLFAPHVRQAPTLLRETLNAHHVLQALSLLKLDLHLQVFASYAQQANILGQTLRTQSQHALPVPLDHTKSTKAVQRAQPVPKTHMEILRGQPAWMNAGLVGLIHPQGNGLASSLKLRAFARKVFIGSTIAQCNVKNAPLHSRATDTVMLSLLLICLD